MGRIWLLGGPCLVAAGAAAFAIGAAVDAGGLVFAGMVVFLGAVIASVTIWSIERYSAIELDAAKLRVGRDAVATTELTSLMTAEQLPADVVERANDPFPRKGTGGRLFGGGWGLGSRLKPIGFTALNRPEIQVIGSRNPERLVAELRIRRPNL